MHSRKPLARFALRTFAAAAVTATVGVLGAGCLTRPVQPGTPETKTNFTAQVRQAAVDKIDLLFMVDNSASMGDKQALLALAVPDLITRLVTPNCLDQAGKVVGVTNDGSCTDSVGGKTAAAGSKAEFQPVHDMHIGIVSSALGGRGSDACPDGAKNPTNSALDTHNNDNGHLIARGGTDEHAVADAAQGNFLAWFPQTTKNTGHPNPPIPITSVGADGQGGLIGDFADMIRGVHEYGCGFEAQLESWYRFLIQPDPYNTLNKDPQSGRVSLADVDQTILQQRHDFLRPDSLVAIIMLTDETDSTVDPLALGGQGWAYENNNFPNSTTGGGAAMGTAVCATNPEDPNCTSCGFCDRSQNPPAPAAVCGDTNCSSASQGYYQPADDALNVRFFHMKQRFGIDPQFPISRYVNGLQSTTVPDRDGEHPATSGGGVSANYVGNNDCTNPLYASNLPTDPSQELCKLPKGARGTDLVFIAAVTGVPWELLLENPTPPFQGAFKSKLSDADWNKLIGKDPINYDFSGADPRMLESIDPRPGLPGPTSSDTADPIMGREWNTNKGDLQYACTFPLPEGSKDCTLPANKNACDCDGTKAPPLCGTPNTTQVRGKAYPCIRELAVIRAMGDQGIASSLCPRVDGSGALLPNTDPDYGYRPAVRGIIDRLKNALSNQCLPQALTPDAAGNVPCLILLTLTSSPGDESLCGGQGLQVPDPNILDKFRQQQASDFKAAGGADAGLQDPAQFPVCQLPEIAVAPGDTCASQNTAGWCYVTNSGSNTPAGTCSQAIVFTATGSPAGAQISLQCIQSSGGDDGGATNSTASGG